MKKPRNNGNIPSSFRDPDGFLFYRDGEIYRQINISYRENYNSLIHSGLYERLVKAKLLIPHQEVSNEAANPDSFYKIIKPEAIAFISYPYEWCFSQLKDAALTTLKIQKEALDCGMTLKDCSAYNIQFRKGRPVFIDTLSFERYSEGQPWVAYRQFCQHFLAPLALMSYTDVRLSQLFRIYIDGIPLDLASALLPFYTHFKFLLLSHIHIHAKAQRHFADKALRVSSHKMRRLSFYALIDNLTKAVSRLKWCPPGSEWANYYEDTNYSHDALKHKEQIVAEFLDKVHPQDVWELGANRGIFSRIASNKRIPTISFDIDHLAVEKSYLECIKKKETHLLPLVLDLTNPSPGIGWQNQERPSLLARGPADTVFILALIHHLTISNNLPFHKLASFLSKICKTLIIEFVPKSDSQVQRLLLTREDIFTDYTQEAFERELGRYFTIQASIQIRDSARIIYLMQKEKA